MMSHVAWHDIIKHSMMYLLHYDVTCCVAWHHKALYDLSASLWCHMLCGMTSQSIMMYLLHYDVTCVAWHHKALCNVSAALWCHMLCGMTSQSTLQFICFIMMSHVVWHDITKHSTMYLLHYDVTCCVAWHRKALYDVPAASWCHMLRGMTSQSTLRCTCCIMMSHVVWHDITKHSMIYLLHHDVTCCVAWHHKALYDVPAASWCYMLRGMTSQSTIWCTCCIMMLHVAWHDITKHYMMYLLHHDVTYCVAWHHKALYDVPAALRCHMLCVGTLPRSLNKENISNVGWCIPVICFVWRTCAHGISHLRILCKFDHKT